MFKIDYEAEYAAITEILEGGRALFNPRFINASTSLARMCENKEYIKLIRYRQKLIEKNLVSQKMAKALEENSALRFLYLCSLHDCDIYKTIIDKKNSIVRFRIQTEEGRIPLKSLNAFKKLIEDDKNIEGLMKETDIDKIKLYQEARSQKISIIFFGAEINEDLNEMSKYNTNINWIYNVKIEEKISVTFKVRADGFGERDVNVTFEKAFVYEE